MTVMDRREAVRALTEGVTGVLGEEVLVVSGLGSPSYDLFAAGDRELNFYLWGAMGGAAMMGLGLALAQPDRPVLVLTGDGEALMGLGALATIAVRRPTNLTLAVLDNGHYGETGMQRSHSGQGVPLHDIATAAGFPQAVELTDLDQVARFAPEILELDSGPRFATLRIAAEEQPRCLPPRDGVHLKNRFRAALGLPVT